MKCIVLGNLKGGVGKTTAAVNLSYSFSLLGKSVLAVDLDPQANMTSFFTKVNQNGRTVKDLFICLEKGGRAVSRTKYKGIDIIKGNTGLREADAGNGEALPQALNKVAGRYDICVIDTRPALEKLTCAALYTADMLLTPVLLDNFCRDNLAMLEEALHGLSCQADWKIFVNKVNTRRRSQRNTYRDLLMRQEYPILDTCISESADISNALDRYKPVKRHHSNGTAARDFMDLARELAEGLIGDGK